MPEVPAHQRIDTVHRCKGYMLRVFEMGRPDDLRCNVLMVPSLAIDETLLRGAAELKSRYAD